MDDMTDNEVTIALMKKAGEIIETQRQMLKIQDERIENLHHIINTQRHLIEKYKERVEILTEMC
ncbi:hypothetical protein EBR57_08845 [bacterium]|nr:hypothetical protein [bacterium]